MDSFYQQFQVFLNALETISIGRMRYLVLIPLLLFNSCSDDKQESTSLSSHAKTESSFNNAFQDNEPDSILKYTETLSDQHLSNSKEIAFLRSRAHRLKGDLYLAIKDGLQARSMIDFNHPDSLDAEILFLSAQLYTDIGQYDNAIEDYQKAIAIFKSFNHPTGHGKCLNSIALIYYRIDEIEKARQYNNDALNIWEVHPFPLGIASSHTIKGYLLSKRQQYDQAIKNLDKASKIYQDIEDRERYANSLLNTGEVYLNSGFHSKACELFEKSIELSAHFSYRQIYVDGFNKLGQCLTKQNNFDQAEVILKSGLGEAEQIGDRALLAEFYHHLALLYQTTDEFKLAAEFQQKYASQKDSILKHARILRIAEFEIQYQTAEINEQNKLLQEKNQRRLMYIGFLSILSIFVLIMIFLISGRYKMRVKLLGQEQLLQQVKIKQQKLENEKLESDTKLKEEENKKLQLELDHHQKELSNITLHLYQKNENLNQLLAELKQIEDTSDTEGKKKLSTLKRAIRNNLNLDQDWERFKTHFDQVHEGFIEKLHQEFPSLTVQDLRHCAYIRMNLSTKEIAQLINITTASVQKSRVRLKKKLDLGRETDLFHFILQF